MNDVTDSTPLNQPFYRNPLICWKGFLIDKCASLRNDPGTAYEIILNEPDGLNVNPAELKISALAAEKAALDRILKNMRGNDLLQIGDAEQAGYSESACVLRTFFLGNNPNGYQQKPFIQAHSHCLPIQSESIDIVLLLHQFDATKDPLAILQEAHRVLRPNGQIVIVGFNQWSLWNCFHRTARFDSMFTPRKIKRLLSAVDFEVTQHETFCFWPSSVCLEMLGLFCLPYVGAVAMLVALKNIPGMTPLAINNFGDRAPSLNS